MDRTLESSRISATSSPADRSKTRPASKTGTSPPQGSSSAKSSLRWCHFMTFFLTMSFPTFFVAKMARNSAVLLYVNQIKLQVDAEAMHSRTRDEGPTPVPPGRLVSLLQQAVGYQIEFNRYHPQATPKVRDMQATPPALLPRTYVVVTLSRSWSR